MMPRKQSRLDRWSESASEARTALDSLRSALEALNEVKAEYEEWRDNLPENLAQSALGEKLNAVADLDFDADGLLSEADNAIGEAEGADLPLGFGRD